ncbi:DUF72 domain-containing protein [Sphingomonas sp.]|jgi:uncharacterized protein YecE (DUF72 family)|uniref:DUF72 domain-containing protein n=1 Tax=Sphingomonas sp. TaxID=28214 RepID=UPI002D7F47CE|nr:DUF72 domain-containing protein [Sphingomonas sp.]HEU0043977.1 DUF72 domain-containing protein [Sphingomonas sp.]
MRAGPVLIGTAGWSIPTALAGRFGGDGAHLHRYGRVLRVAEINSSFHRPHRAGTYRRWADSVPEDFRFSVKLPKTISHKQRLIDVEGLLDTFLAEASALGEKLAVWLLQLPPSFAFDGATARAFFTLLRQRSPATIACEPRHPSWFDLEPDALLDSLGVARVAADPALVPGAERPGGWRGLHYHRLHGSPRIYHSSYNEAWLRDRATGLAAAAATGTPIWCIFDNTASGAAAADALTLRAMLDTGDEPQATL